MVEYYPAEEQMEEKNEDEIREEMEIGERDEEVYDEEGREKLLENDEISPAEEGFMEGAEGGGKGAKCRKCGKILLQDFVEKEIDGEIYRFCSNKCANSYEKK